MQREVNPWEVRARFIKARLIADLIWNAYHVAGVTGVKCSDVARSMNAGQRLKAAKEVGKRSVSADTWLLVVVMLMEQES